MNLCDLAPQYIRDIAPYQPGKPISELERELGITDIIKLASNENPLGPSPRALESVRGELAQLALYPDGNGYALKQALAAKLGVGMEAIVLGNGSNDVLELAARTFLKPGASAVFSQHAFLVYPLVVKAVGATAIVTPASDYAHDLPAMARAIRADTRIVFIANPNNPTGTFARAETLAEFLRQVPREVLVVLDEAYTEYLPPQLAANSVAWLRDFPNLIITRTFSKAYGLAGLRIGYGLAHPEVADLMNRVRQPFNANSLALAAAQAALDDAEFLARSRATNEQGMRQLEEGFKRMGLEYIPSVANFITVKAGAASAIYQALLKRGVIVRPVANYELPEFLRVTIGTPAQNTRFLSALEAVLGQQHR
jgi:histidinol-phosphate aminotransferase